MSIWADLKRAVESLNYLSQYLRDPMALHYSTYEDYYTGDHRLPLKTKPGQADENIVQNFTGLAIDRSISRLFRGGVTFALPEGAEAQQEYLDSVWDVNKQEILLYQLGLNGSVYGTVYVKIMLDGIIDPITGVTVPRLMPINPVIIRMKVNPVDKDDVLRYRIEYPAVDEDTGRTTIYRELTEKQANGTWLITYEIKEGLSNWKQWLPPISWGYNFPPILNWKNLPSINNIYGENDIDDVINIQDKNNFIVSNTGKMIKYHAAPPTIGTGFSANAVQKVDSAPDANFWAIPQENAKVYNLSNSADIEGSRNFAKDLRQNVFDVAREVDLSNIADKLGNVTNFGLHVLYTDALDKNDVKRQLYGDALRELNRRLLVLAGWSGEASNPGEVQWGEALPVNIIEEMQADRIAIEMKIVDKQTVAQRYLTRWGESWEEIEQRLEEEQNDAQERFNRGGGTAPNDRSGQEGADSGGSVEADDRLRFVRSEAEAR